MKVVWFVETITDQHAIKADLAAFNFHTHSTFILTEIKVGGFIVFNNHKNQTFINSYIDFSPSL